MIKCVVTGANGFVGSAVVKRLHEMDRFVVGAVVRQGGHNFPLDVAVHSGLELSGATDWMPALSGVDCVIHAAARVHVMHDIAADALGKFREINVEGTLNLARQSAVAGVRRFVFISSIKVNGEGTAPGCPYTPDDAPAPANPYGISKREAEQALRQLAAKTCMEVVIIRPPLVYGPGVKANFLAMMRWLRRGIPLPLGAVTGNKRSLVALDNLVDLIVTCLEPPGAANQTSLVSDDEDLSTAALLRRMGVALGQPARLIPVPVSLLKLGASIIGKPGVMQRLCGSLEVDIGKTRELLGWVPPITVDEGLRLTAAHWATLRQASSG